MFHIELDDSLVHLKFNTQDDCVYSEHDIKIICSRQK